MRTLSIDIETYSSVGLKESGVYAYCEAPDFQILLFAYAFDDGDVEIIDLARGEGLPTGVIEALFDNQVVKTAFNANFELTCIQKYLDKYYFDYDLQLDPKQWRCTAVLASMVGLPGYLEGVAKTLGFPENKQKDASGKALIKYFCVPCKPTKKNFGRLRNLPEQDLDKWNLFRAYCIQDVVVEREVKNKLDKYQVLIPQFEHDLWVLDQKISCYGSNMDTQLIAKAIEADAQNSEALYQEASELTGLDNPNSVAQLKDWFQENEDTEIESLNKKVISELKEGVSDTGQRVLELRQEMSKTSVKKYQAMERAMCQDGRIRGFLQFYGANRTGRWAGRLVQVQNLPQNKIPDLDLARNLLKSGEYELIDLLFTNIPSVLSQLIRTAFIPSVGHKFIVSDFSAIEARVIAWLANEKWRLDVFASHGKIYEASASQMFHVPIEQINKGNPLRQKGKIAELALGYQGSVGALLTMGALEMGLTEDELPGIVKAWRKANPAIVRLWRDVEDAAVEAVAYKAVTKIQKGIEFIPQQGIMFVRLPSGRHLAYIKPSLNEGKLSYEGVNQTTKKWEKIPTYGGKLVENIVQAIARDCLAEAMMKLDTNGYKIVMHVHDEVINDVPLQIKYGTYTEEVDIDEELRIVGKIMSEPIDWAPGLLLRADGYVCEYYKKD
jgi:DNA polymerase